jgi:hypothetical protein
LENPIPVSAGGASTSSRWIVRAALANAKFICTLLVLWTIWKG